MRFPWFKRIGLFWFPVKISGWIIFLAAVGYSVFSFIEIDRVSHSVSDTLMNFVFRLIIIGALYSIIAFITGFKKI